ncbi:hypothetical protein C6A85_000000106990, partial [Mycobacterium sp. ITM-2017-0098]
MGSRARIAAAACLVASGLLAGGTGAAVAAADIGSADSEDAPDRHTEKVPRSDREDDGAHAADPADPADPADEKPVDGTNGEDPPPGEGKVPSGRPGAEDDVEDSGEVGGEVGGEVVAELPPPPCCTDGTRDCEPGWPWPWPWPVPDDPGDLPTSDGEYGENRPETVPPIAPMPPMGEPESPRILDVVPGIGAGPGDATQAPISVPIII